MPPNIKGLIYSILTAIITGGVVALLAIFVFNYFPRNIIGVAQVIAVSKNATTSNIADSTNDVNMALIEEGEEDPTFISRFSRAFIYSADDGREVIESAKDSLPTMGNVIVSASAYVVIDIDRDMVVLEKNADKLFPLASVTKLVTAVISKRLFDQNDYITVSKKALNTYGNEARLREGEKFRIKELLYPLLMVSSNDASEVLAQRYDREKFINEMNNWVKTIGAYHTRFADPSGLSPQNISTARDLSIITKWIMENQPDIFDITLLKAQTIRTHTWTNPAHFLNLVSYAGGKNGYTGEAHKTSVSLFKLGKQKRLFAVILLGSFTRDNDILDLLDEAVR